MSILEMFLWAILAAQSVMAVACFVTALQVCLFTKGQDRDKPGTERCLADLRELSAHAKSGTVQDPAARLASLCKRLERLESGLATVMHYVLMPQKDILNLDVVIYRSLSRVERRARAVCDFLTRFAPQTGLAGMLLGVQQAISNAGTGGDSAQLNNGIAVALTTTLWGVLCECWRMQPSQCFGNHISPARLPDYMTMLCSRHICSSQFSPFAEASLPHRAQHRPRNTGRGCRFDPLAPGEPETYLWKWSRTTMQYEFLNPDKAASSHDGGLEAGGNQFHRHPPRRFGFLHGAGKAVGEGTLVGSARQSSDGDQRTVA